MTALEPIDHKLLDFLCSVEANRHCIVRSVKTRLRPSLRRLRYAGLVWFDSFTPSASAMADWRERQLTGSPPPKAASEEQPLAKAAEEGGAAARFEPAAPPMLTADPTCAELYRALVAEGAKRGLSPSAVSNQVFGNAAQMSSMKSREGPPRPKTLFKIKAWLGIPRDTPGASGTARKAPSAEGSPSASRDTVSAPPSPAELFAEIEAWLAKHPKCTKTTFGKLAFGRGSAVTEMCQVSKLKPKTIRRAREFMANPPAEAFSRQRRPVGSPPIPKPPKAVRASRPAPAEPARPASPNVQGQRVAARVRRQTTEAAKRRIEAGLDAKNCKSANIRHAQFAIEAEMAVAAKLADPIEQAKQALRKKYTPVVSMSVYGGRDDLFMVGSRKDVTQDELIAMAGRLAA